ncbi:uncharacterized protein AB675_8823 [Cyphellophora attinorum]|uniref:Uncharacterized protein n=1 Tax=Cyphellophora attinorum TaxID=1664694 RepID=A0A0N1P3Z5_9EURO|nr:uncharacterized protein AB675_8823 [Phialophora attinorum]KPI44786.1 hypothetical protein AB675_8823 [Phialophora attinorum]
MPGMSGRPRGAAATPSTKRSNTKKPETPSFSTCTMLEEAREKIPLYDAEIGDVYLLTWDEECQDPQECIDLLIDFKEGRQSRYGHVVPVYEHGVLVGFKIYISKERPHLIDAIVAHGFRALPIYTHGKNGILHKAPALQLEHIGIESNDNHDYQEHDHSCVHAVSLAEYSKDFHSRSYIHYTDSRKFESEKDLGVYIGTVAERDMKSLLEQRDSFFDQKLAFAKAYDANREGRDQDKAANHLPRRPRQQSATTSRNEADSKSVQPSEQPLPKDKSEAKEKPASSESTPGEADDIATPSLGVGTSLPGSTEIDEDGEDGEIEPTSSPEETVRLAKAAFEQHGGDHLSLAYIKALEDLSLHSTALDELKRKHLERELEERERQRESAGNRRRRRAESYGQQPPPKRSRGDHFSSRGDDSRGSRDDRSSTNHYNGTENSGIPNNVQALRDGDYHVNYEYSSAYSQGSRSYSRVDGYEERERYQRDERIERYTFGRDDRHGHNGGYDRGGYGRGNDHSHDGRHDRGGHNHREANRGSDQYHTNGQSTTHSLRDTFGSSAFFSDDQYGNASANDASLPY